MDASDEPRQAEPAARACPDCGTACAAGQRRCTNCGASVDARRRLTRRTPLIVAVIVAALGSGAVVVAQADVTEKASLAAAAPADSASAPVSVAGAPLPDAQHPTSTKPKPPKVITPDTNTLTIPTLDAPVVSDAAAAREAAAKAAADAKRARESKDGQPVKDDTTANPDDLGDAKRVKVVNADNYDPNLRAGAEFGRPKAAIDKRSRTVWDVNVPADGLPLGVGIVLDLGDEPKRVSQLKIGTPTPGFGAVIYRADSETIPPKVEDPLWTKAAKIKTVSDGMTVAIADTPTWTRYILVYLTTTRDAIDTRAAISDLEVLP